MKQIFVTGMLRSGTTLLQTLLTNHSQLFVTYQPFFQFYLEVKQYFLNQHGMHKNFPLGDGLDTNNEESILFKNWLHEYRFSENEVADILSKATSAKGGSSGFLDLKPAISSGNFFDIRHNIHKILAHHFNQLNNRYIGSKEVLCEEYLPSLLASSVNCILIIRDPRAVIVSASYGKYRELVGDRYPLLMLIRLWRKSANYWLELQNHPFCFTMRYEELTQNAKYQLEKINKWLNVGPFPENIQETTLQDHTGRPWTGNSSFGDKIGVDHSCKERWKTLLSNSEIRFIEACTRHELDQLGYNFNDDLKQSDIYNFRENITDVRKTYLNNYSLTEDNIDIELKIFNKIP